MKTVMALALAAAGMIAAPAAAENVGGRYRVEGTSFNGAPYGGTAEIVVTSKNTCRIVWDTGSIAEGICMRNTNAFAAAYTMGDIVGLVIYEIQPDGRLVGLWTAADRDGVGTETLIPY